MKLFAASTLASIVCACARNEPPPRVPVHWTEADGTPVRDPGRTTESVRYREGQRRSGGSGAYGHEQPYVPHPRCNDGTVAPDCAPNAMGSHCCVNQGGVARDAWGNLLFE